jgi:group I intron endonuclease
MIGIYKITSPSNKVYIGQSTNIKNRWDDYYKMIRCKRQPRLYNSLKKYKPHNHKFEIIEECTEDKLLERETYWKEHYNVLSVPSLCCRMDGKGGKLSQSTKDKMSKNKLGKPTKHNYPLLQYDYLGNFIKEWDNYLNIPNYPDIKKICLDETFIRINNSLWRFKYTSEYSLKLVLPLSYFKKINRLFPILQLDINNKLIKEYKNNTQVISDFLKPLNKEKSSASIYACCKGKQNTAYGFIWKYK